MNAVMHPTIALLQSSSLTTVVQQEIERAILHGELQPGAKLNERELCELLDVSRTYSNGADAARCAAH